MKTWLTNKDGWIHRHNEYGDEPEWIGMIHDTDGEKWFKSYGDNRTLTFEEMQFILSQTTFD